MKTTRLRREVRELAREARRGLWNAASEKGRHEGNREPDKEKKAQREMGYNKEEKGVF